MGSRMLKVEPTNRQASILLAGTDKSLLGSGRIVRLMGLFNIMPRSLSEEGLDAELVDEAIEVKNAPILQWVPTASNLPVDVVMPDASVRNGRGEIGLSSEPIGSVIQFVRFGFARIDDNANGRVRAYFAHE
jgi:hypothetical protein